MWLGLAADAFGFENLFNACWRAREIILDVAEETAGGRVIYGSCIVGGVSTNPDDETLRRCAKELSKVRAEVGRLIEVFVGEPTVRSRLEGVGVLSKEKAHALGAVGPMLRASGIDYDMRRKGYEAYPELEFRTMTESAGDCMARLKVRSREIIESLRLIDEIVERMPGGPVSQPVKGMPEGEAWVRLEQPRGEALYFVRANGKKNPERFRVRTPTFANIPSMVEIMVGSDFADVGTIILTIDPCISCTER
jgi:ech hydrogenase subunit E